MNAALFFTNLIQHASLLMGQSRIEALSNRSGGGQPAVLLVVLAVVILTAATIWLIWHQFSTAQVKRVETLDCSRQLFRELSRAHGLGWADESLLKRLAQRSGLANPVEIFIRPDLLETLNESGGVSPQIGGLRARLFDA